MSDILEKISYLVKGYLGFGAKLFREQFDNIKKRRKT